MTVEAVLRERSNRKVSPVDTTDYSYRSATWARPRASMYARRFSSRSCANFRWIPSRSVLCRGRR